MTAHHTIDFHFTTEPGRTGGQRLRGQKGKEAPPTWKPAPSDIPHPLARRMAMAIECKRLIESGTVADAAEMARIAGVTRARMTQVLDLNLLAPDLQERLLFLNKNVKVNPRTVAKVSRVRSWGEQRNLAKTVISE
jgi:hypothetical protein